MAARKSKPFDIIGGPSYRELVLALTDPDPFSCGDNRGLIFQIIDVNGKKASLRAALFGMAFDFADLRKRAVEKMQWRIALSVNIHHVGDIFFNSDEKWEKFFDSINDAATNVYAIYEPSRRKGKVSLTPFSGIVALF